MSWSLASYALLALGLLAGVAWYERSRPSARVLALVGTLAALAAIGRLAFAPIPNVKPTTDIVLIAGYALGGAPGFMVGAVAALTSNFFFGQGPWTPWEMAAWGLVGVAGAGLARVLGRSLLARRVPLALVCGVAGFGYGAIMDLSMAVTYGRGDGVLGRWAFYSGTSFGYNVAHAIGNVLFALAFGPALVTALTRFRRRLDVGWLTAAPVAALATALVLSAGLSAPGDATAGSSPSGFLARAQNRDGGFGDRPGLGSSPTFSAWATLGLAANRRNPLDVSRGGHSAFDYVRASAGAASRPGDIERTLLVYGAAGRRPPSALVRGLLRHRHRDGSFDGQVNITAFAILGLRGTGSSSSSPTMRRAAAWMLRQADHDGGFNFLGRGGASDIDDTGAAVQALVSAGRRSSSVTRRAVSFLAHRQNPDGGFPANPGGGSNAQSTAWAIQGLVAGRVDPGRLHRGGARSPLAYLRSLTQGDGSVRYSRTSSQNPVWVTGQAALALARRPFPLGRVPRRSRRAAAATASAGTSSGGTSGGGGGARAGVGSGAAGASAVRARHHHAAAVAARRAGARATVTTPGGMIAWSGAAGRLAALVFGPSGPPPSAPTR